MPLVIGRNHEAASSAGATLSGCPSSLVANVRMSFSSSGPPSRALAPRMPAAMHALLEPRPAHGDGVRLHDAQPWNGLPHSAYTSLAVR